MKTQGVCRIAAFYRNAGGAAIVEFALALPVLLTLFYAAVELTRYVLFREKLESAAVQVIDIINQESDVKASQLDNLFSALPVMMQPLRDVNPQPRVTVVERARDPGGRECQLRVLWGYGPGTSRINPERDNRLPEIAVGAGDTVTVIEVIGTYRPILDDAFQRKLLGNLTGESYVRSYARPRYGAFRCSPETGACKAVVC